MLYRTRANLPFCAFLAGLVAFSAFGLATAAVRPAAASELRVSMGGDPDSLDPHKSTLIFARLISQQTFMSMTALAPDGGIEGGTADRWTVSDDGLIYTFHLRDGLHWSDGATFTAEDIVYSFRRMLTPQTLYPNAELFYWIDGAVDLHQNGAPPERLGVTAPDPRTVVFTLASPNPYFPALLATAFPVPRHAIEAHGAAWVQPEHFVGNGAYLLSERIPNNKVVLKRDDASVFAKGADIDTITFYPITESSAQVRRFNAGEIDMVYSVSTTEFDKVKANNPAVAVSFPALRASYLTLNLRNAPLDDARVRKALSLLIERDIIAERIAGGGASASARLMRADWPGIAERAEPDWADTPRAERTKAAKALLADAGYGPGHPLKVEFIYTGELRQKIAVALQGMWRDAGIDAEIRSMEVQGLFSTLDGGGYQIGILAYDMGADPDPYSLLAGFLPGGWAERSGFRDTGFDAHMSAARTLPDRDARGEELAAAEDILIGSFAIAPLYVETAPWLIAARVTGWTQDVQPYYFRRLTVGEP